MPPRKRARPKRTSAAKSRTVRVGRTTIGIAESPGGGQITINGQAIAVTKLGDGSYYSEYAPEQSFPTIEALARALVGEPTPDTGKGARGRKTQAASRAATIKVADDGASMKVTDDLPTLKTADDQPSLKFRDDPTLKPQDDVATIKFSDDPTLKLRDDGPTIKFQDDVPTIKFQDDPTTLKRVDDGPSLKFQDDPTLKLRDDQPSLKFQDDPTLKLRDDLPSLKFQDDATTLKFRDEGGPGTVKFLDDPTLKLRDDGGSLKVLDDGGGGTMKVIDDGTIKFREDIAGPKGPADVMNQPGSPGPITRSAAPFVLATPHHSRVWSETFPQAYAEAVAHYESALAEYESVLQGGGNMAPHELSALQDEYQQLVAEYTELTGGQSG